MLYLLIFPIDKPECQTAATTYFIYNDPINVTCIVSSHPISSSFQWKWNTGSDIINSEPFNTHFERSLTKGHPRSDRTLAKLTVYPSKNSEDRELACWAENSMGVQDKPCIFAIKVASEDFFLVLI